MNQENLNKQRNRNAKQRQQQSRSNKQEWNTFDQLGLTKRNVEYMFKFNQALRKTKVDPDKKDQMIHDMVDKLKDNQSKGVTARQLYGTVDERIEHVVHPPKPRSSMLNKSYWPNAVYNMLIFFIMFNAIYGLTYLFTRSQQTQQNATGIVGLTLTSVVAGLGMPIITRLFDNNYQHRFNAMIRFLIMIGMFVVWIAAFYGLAYLPHVLNPSINPWANIILAIIAIGVAIWVHKKWNVTSSFRMNR